MSVTMSQTFHNRRMNLFFEGCQNLFGQLVAEMAHRGEVKVKVDNGALGHLNVDVNFGVGLKASSTMVIEPASCPAGINVSNRISMISTSTLVSSFATDMNEMFNHLVVSVIFVRDAFRRYHGTPCYQSDSWGPYPQPSSGMGGANILMPGDIDSLPGDIESTWRH